MPHHYARSIFWAECVPSLCLFALLASTPAAAQTCPNPDALGTSRVLAVSAATTPRVGRKQFPQTLPLGPKELVLTFDDGPIPATTPRILDALKAECVRATFFLIGREAAAASALVRREAAEGHTVAHHTWSHPLLNRMPTDRAEAEINRGIAADEYALYGMRRTDPTVPFFRFPGFASTPALLDRLERRHIVVFGADVWASDWNEMTPQYELDLILRRIDKIGRGIVLLHDSKARTARMLPSFLRELKRRGYHIVHVVPTGHAPLSH
jgi:peptidoglycan/xylan/chitin deacetylase (PgdA/CDA1 family)